MSTQQGFYQHPNPYIAGKQTWQRATARDAIGEPPPKPCPGCVNCVKSA